MMKIGFAGGAQEVGGSCICLRVGEIGILMDAGIRQGGSKDPLPDFRLIQDMGGIDAIVISHAHMDHIGSLPLISRAYPQAPIYMTPMTMDLTRVLLQDSLKIMAQREEEIPLYSETEVSAMMDRIIPLHEQVEREIQPGVSLTFYPAGHIAGAACVYLQTPEGSLFYSGDFAAFAQQTIDGIRIPKLRPDVCIVESTYGDKLHANRQVEEGRLIRMVGEAVAEGKKILIPSFALGRAQEVILLLRAGISQGIIPRTPIYVDGMVRDICRVYKLHPSNLRGKLARSILKGNEPFYTEDIQPVAPNADRNALLEAKGPAVFVASSGMLSGGPSVQYAEKIVSREDGMIIITGYQDEEAPGKALLKLAEAAEESRMDGTEDVPTFTLSGKSIPIRATVRRVGLSAHGDQEEILSLLTRLSPRDVILVHGDAEVQPQLAQRITGEYLRRVMIPACGDIEEIVYHTARKQPVRNWPWTMGREGIPEEAGQEDLWSFLREHYPDRELNAMNIMEIWSGRKASENEEIYAWQSMLIDSAFFVSNPHRLFLFHPATEEELAEARAPKAINLQTLQDLAAELFGSLGYKKVSVYPEEQRVALRFSFPDAVNLSEFQQAAEDYEARTGWTVSIYPGANHTEIQQLLRSLFGDRVRKSSTYEAEKLYQVTLSQGQSEDAEYVARFQKVTGWHLRLFVENSSQPGETSGNHPSESRSFQPLAEGEKMEQNAAFAYIRETCASQGIPMQKLGLYSDHLGKRIDLTFITPQVGARYADQLEQLSADIGWRILISDAVMQNLVFAEAAEAAQEAGLTLKKNPAYLPMNHAVQLKTTDHNPEAEAKVAAMILEKTGLACRIVC